MLDVAVNILGHRLRRLVEVRLLTSGAYGSGTRPRKEYGLTDAGVVCPACVACPAFAGREAGLERPWAAAGRRVLFDACTRTCRCQVLGARLASARSGRACDAEVG